MLSVSAIIFINLACVYGWNTLLPSMDIDHFSHLINNVNIGPNDSSNVTTHHMQLHLDHFNLTEKKTIRIYYMQNLDFWQPNGPIYIWLLRSHFYEVEGWPISINNTFIFALAQETKGAMFLLQERYYQPSVPKIPKSEENKYFNYLSTAQQLADTAQFIEVLKSKPEYQSSKVVIMGMQESASHATWMRLVYPNLVDAAVATSAPLLAKKGVKEIYEFTADLYDKYGHKDCINKIEKKFQEFTDALKNKTALDIFKHKYRLCDFVNFTEIKDQQLYMGSRYNRYVVTGYLGYFQDIKDCKCHDEEVGITRPRTWSCASYHYDSQMKSVQRMKEDMIKFYQQCTEYGQGKTTSAEKRPFVHYSPLTFGLEYCKDVFGVDEKRLDEGIAQTNLLYGGLTPNVTNVVFTHGDLNPYKLLGVQQNLSDSAPAFVVKEDGYINIMIINKNESKYRIEVRNRVKNLIKEWIGL